MPDPFERATAPDVAVNVADDIAADAEPAGVHCFICQLDTRACEVAALEGALVERDGASWRAAHPWRAAAAGVGRAGCCPAQ